MLIRVGYFIKVTVIILFMTFVAAQFFVLTSQNMSTSANINNDSFREKSDQSKAPVLSKQDKSCPICSDRVIVPGGKFWTGATGLQLERAGISGIVRLMDEEPLHEASVRSFAISRYDVTRKEFAAFARATGFRETGCSTHARGLLGDTWNIINPATDNIC